MLAHGNIAKADKDMLPYQVAGTHGAYKDRTRQHSDAQSCCVSESASRQRVSYGTSRQEKSANIDDKV